MPNDISATLGELHHALGTILMQRPDFKGKRVAIATECGLSSAEIKSPVSLYLTEDEEVIHIQTTDDKESFDLMTFGGIKNGIK